MELGVQRRSFLLNFDLECWIPGLRPFPNVLEELSNLVRVLARSRNFDGACPVEIEVTQCECQVLDLTFGQWGVVLRDVKVDWQNTTLVGCCGGKEEVKLLLGIVAFNELLVNKTAWRWVRQISIAVIHKESLGDAFVYNDDSDLGRLQCFVLVDCLDRIFKLRDFVSKNLIPLCITDTVSVDNKVSWTLVLVVLLKGLDCSNDGLAHVCLNNFLALLLFKVFAIVLGHFTVNARWKSNNRVRTWMTNIYTNKHCSFLVENCREFHIVQVPSNFAVNLLKDVTRNW